jgi:hypothetical protein
MVLAECAIVGALVVVAWHLVVNPPVVEVPYPTPATATPDEESSVGPASAAVNAQRQPTPAPVPGLNVDANFWRLRLAELNRREAEFEALEWKVVRSAMDAAHRYVESVVLPAIARAERR